MTCKSILTASFMHESNTFSETLTDLDTFRETETWGGDVIDAYRGTNSELGGAIDVAEREGVELRPVVATEATPGGPVSREASDHYVDAIVDGAREHADDVDGVFLALHGAMVPEGGDDGEGPLIRAVREAVDPDVPVAVTLDHHANVTAEMVEEADALVAYETYPHVDMAETGERAMEILLGAIAGEVSPEMAIERPPILATGANSNTSDLPMRALMDRARELEKRDGVLKVNVMPGFFRADISIAGFSVPVVSDGDRDLARSVAREMGATVWDHREGFAVDRPEPAEAVAEAADLVARGETADGPVVLADVGDNPGGGGSGDETALLRELLDADVGNAGVAMICDPDVVDACTDAGVRESVTVGLGGKSPNAWTDPIENVSGYVKGITDGVFVRTGPMNTGRPHDFGGAVRFECGDDRDVTVAVTRRRHQPYDAELWRHLGVNPEDLDVVVVKSSNHYRGAYEPLASRIVPVDSPGLNVIDPDRLDYEHLRRPVFPIDEMAEDAYPDW